MQGLNGRGLAGYRFIAKDGERVQVMAAFEYVRLRPIGVDSPVAQYLRNRGFASLLPHERKIIKQTSVKIGRRGHSTEEALAAIIHGKDGKVVGYQVLPVDKNGRALEDVSDDFVRVKARRTLYPKDDVGDPIKPDRSSAVRLGAVTPDGELAVAEGVEDAMSVSRIEGLPCWAIMGADRMEWFTPPPEVRHLIVARDNDSAGMVSATRLISRLRTKERRVTVIRPSKEVKDYNDLWRSRGTGGT